MIQIAKIGRTVGVHGGLKLHILSDFPQIFQPNLSLIAQRSGASKQKFILRIKKFENNVVRFCGYETMQSAQTLVNVLLFMSLEDTRKLCLLQEGEVFWFDVLGCSILEEGKCLGVVKDIERIAGIDYLIIQTQSSPKSFMLPYLSRYIVRASFKERKIFTSGARDIWQES